MRLFDRESEGGNRPLLGFILATLLVGAAGSLITAPQIPVWYSALLKPSFSPPDWVFAPVWTTLYILMAVAAWRVWRVAGLKSPELMLFWLQLAFNLAWCAIFFGLHRITAGLAEIVVLWLLILATLVLFWRRDRWAGLLFLPTLAWTGFALLLNLAIWRLNV